MMMIYVFDLQVEEEMFMCKFYEFILDLGLNKKVFLKVLFLIFWDLGFVLI